ncbi:MAG TPA: glycosyl transferase [Bacteroidetes bacterium]|nr:glycosyl transferase [Bacteroidota bacterium]
MKRAFRSLQRIMNPKLSIITVTFNAEKFIEPTILSVGAQHFTDREYIVVDGLSGDATVDILKKHPGIVNRWISEKDGGLYDAMNKAIRMAQGEYLMFLNAGDLFFDDEVLDEVFKQAGDVDLIYGDTAIIDTNYEMVGMRHMRPPKHLDWKSFKNGMVVCHQAIIAKRNLVPFYDLNYRVAADIDWAIRLTKLAKTFYFYKEPIVRFMQDGISTLHRKQGLKERYQIQTRYFGRFPTLLNTFWLGLKYLLSLRFISNVRK